MRASGARQRARQLRRSVACEPDAPRTGDRTTTDSCSAAHLSHPHHGDHMTMHGTTCIPYRGAGAELPFRVAPVTGDAEHGHSSMSTGAWIRDANGRPCRGALGVMGFLLATHALGILIYRRKGTS